MTDQQINAAIAEACKWTNIRVCWCSKNVLRGKSPSGNCGHIPDYCTDLNAMHEAESILQRMKFEFTQWLLEIVSRDDDPGTWYASGAFAHVHATARQRAEAFLRTLGKWEEVQA